jgi:hypothetical protein
MSKLQKNAHLRYCIRQLVDQSRRPAARPTIERTPAALPLAESARLPELDGLAGGAPVPVLLADGAGRDDPPGVVELPVEVALAVALAAAWNAS